MAGVYNGAHHTDATLDHPLALKAAKSDPDTITWEEAMSLPKEKDQWIEAAKKEIADLVKIKTWTEVPYHEAKKSVVPVVWVFKRKRLPDGTISKFKARICV